jgi:uncharacterized protein YgiM (DUF1202 family)
MKKNILVFFMMIFCLSGIFAKVGNTMYVTSEEVTLKEKPSFFSNDLENIYYGDAVIILQEKGNWAKICLDLNSSTTGWINTSSLSKKKIVSTSNRVSASTSELSLAGKGFNAEIESQYKISEIVDYDAVDKLEKNMISFTTIVDFMKSGKLLIQNIEQYL